MQDIPYVIETVQVFLCKLGMKPHMHILELNICITKQCYCQTYQNYEQPPLTSQSNFSLLQIGWIFGRMFDLKEKIKVQFSCFSLNINTVCNLESQFCLILFIFQANAKKIQCPHRKRYKSHGEVNFRVNFC